MAEIDLTPEQTARLRARLGFRDGDRELTADDLIVVIDAEQLVDDEAARWEGLGPESQP